jgi:Arc/MetJ-type ribon-helix-helix transcriptional regulator
MYMNTRVNINVPEALFEQSNALVEKGYFSNFSELVRQGLREVVRRYEDKTIINEDERKLFALLKHAGKEGLLGGGERF